MFATSHSIYYVLGLELDRHLGWSLKGIYNQAQSLQKWFGPKEPEKLAVGARHQSPKVLGKTH